MKRPACGCVHDNPVTPHDMPSNAILKKTEDTLRELGYQCANSTDTRRGRTIVILEHWTGPNGVAILERWHPATGQGMTADYAQLEYVEVFMPSSNGSNTVDAMLAGVREAVARNKRLPSGLQSLDEAVAPEEAARVAAHDAARPADALPPTRAGYWSGLERGERFIVEGEVFTVTYNQRREPIRGGHYIGTTAGREFYTISREEKEDCRIVIEPAADVLARRTELDKTHPANA